MSNAFPSLSDSISEQDPSVSLGWLVAIVLGPALLVTLLYLNTLSNEFVYDDFQILVSNRCLSEKVPVSTALARDVWCLEGENSTGSWRPMTFLVLRGMHSLVGLQEWPYHLVNLLIFALAAGFAGLFVWRISNKPEIALGAGLLYSAHPGHSEAVASVAGSSDVLSAALLIAGFVVYAGLLCYSSQVWRRFAGMALLFLALLAKESALTGFAVFFLIDLTIILRSRSLGEKPWYSNWKLLGSWLGSILLVLGYLAVRQALFGGVGTQIHFQDNPLANQPPGTYYPTAFAALGEYLRLMLWPLRLSVDYGYNQIPLAEGFGSLRVLGPLVVLVLSTVLAVVSFKKNKVLSIGILLIWSSLSIASNLIVTIPTMVAERLLIVPNLGVAMVAAAGVVPLAKRFPKCRLLVVVLLVTVLSAMSFRVAIRNTEWRSNLSLFLSAAHTTPESRKVQLNAGWFLRLEGAYSKALEHYRKADAIDPSLRDAFLDRELGICYHGIGNFSQAVFHYERVLKLTPGDAMMQKLLDASQNGWIPSDLHKISR